MIVKYEDIHEKAWDRFVLKESLNGTILQTRVFLNYHPKDRFEDHSLLFMKGNNIIAVIPANLVQEQGKRCLISHQGSTFGGIILGKEYKKLAELETIFEELEKYLAEQNIAEISLKQTSMLYQSQTTELLDYYLFLKGYHASSEIGYYLPVQNLPEEIEQVFTSSRRRGYRNSLKNQLCWKELTSDTDIQRFYGVLESNMRKFDTTPVHSLPELYDLKNRLQDSLQFYGVYQDDTMVGGSMVFAFGQKVFHSQYLATDQEKTDLHVSEFMYYHLFQTAKEKGFEHMSLGTATLEHGYVLNHSLALFKEGFGTTEYVNRTYHKSFTRVDKTNEV